MSTTWHAIAQLLARLWHARSETPLSKAKCRCLDPNAPRAPFGSLRVLPSGRHQARYTGPDGRSYRGPHTFDTHGDADAYLARVRSEISREVWKPPTSRRAAAPSTFAAFAEDWLLVRELRPRTRTHYRQLLDRQILPRLGDLPLAEISPSIVRSWYASLDSSRPTLRAHAYGLLRAIMATAVADEVIAANPCRIRGAGASKRAKKLRPATLDDLERLVLEMPAKYRLAVLLSAWCALRIGEVTELRRRDVDLKAKVIRVRRAVTWVDGEPAPIVGPPKSDAGSRDVAIPPHLVPVIRTHLEAGHAQWGADGLLFPSQQGTQLRSSTIYASWWPARKRAGRPDLRWHDLRHTGATLAAQEGATLRELMVRIGHSTPAAALIYQHAAAERDAELAARLSARAAQAASDTR